MLQRLSSSGAKSLLHHQLLGLELPAPQLGPTVRSKSPSCFVGSPVGMPRSGDWGKDRAPVSSGMKSSERKQGEHILAEGASMREESCTRACRRESKGSRDADRAQTLTLTRVQSPKGDPGSTKRHSETSEHSAPPLLAALGQRGSGWCCPGGAPSPGPADPQLLGPQYQGQGLLRPAG